MTHIYPKSRVCLIDVTVPFKKGFKRAIDFAKKYNVPINTADGRRLVTGFCLEYIVNTFDSTKSSFPKATFLSKKEVPRSLLFFIENYFEDILKQAPLHYCGLHEKNSPDLEYVASNALKRTVTKRDYFSLLSKLKVRKIA